MNKILALIKPSKKEQHNFARTTALFLKTINKNLKDAKAILGGSGAKGTGLSGNYDIDIFVLFNLKKYASQTDTISSLLEGALKKSFPHLSITKLHGSRDYFQLTFQTLSFEVVPILKVAKAQQAINITDVSPLHSQWVNKRAHTLKDQILLAKQFCKANSMYGAESYIGGFSGYVLEILITKYGSLRALLKASEKWKLKEVVDVEKQYPKKDALFQLNQSKLQSPLIVIDPVDKNRNAAAALSMEKFKLFQHRAQEYLKKPSDSFFIKQKWSLENLKKEAKNKTVLGLTLLPHSGKEDVVGGQLLKAFQFLQKELQPFIIHKAAWEWDQKDSATLYVVVNKTELPPFEIRCGPPSDLTNHVREFKHKNKDTFLEKGRIMARIKIEHTLLKDFVQHLIQHPYFKEKMKAVKKIEIV